MDDARLAVETGVDGVDIVIGTSSFLREHSHGKDMTWITKSWVPWRFKGGQRALITRASRLLLFRRSSPTPSGFTFGVPRHACTRCIRPDFDLLHPPTISAIEVIQFVKSKGIEVRFSSEDSFRSELVDLLSIYRTVDKIGLNRVGVADTVGCADPRQVYDLVRTLRGVVSCDIECHFHNDTGCGECCQLP